MRRSPWSTGRELETLTEIAQLEALYEEHGYTGRRDGDAAELEALRALRPVLRELLTAERDAAAERLNAPLAEGGGPAELKRHDGLDWHIHAVDPPTRRSSGRVMAEAAMAMVDLIRADELSRLSVCADERCEGARARLLAQPLPPLLQAPRARTATPSPPTARGASPALDDTPAHRIRSDGVRRGPGPAA